MKYKLLTLLFLIPLIGMTQVKWQTAIVQIAENTFELHITELIDSGYSLGALNECKEGPKLIFQPNPAWKAVGKPDIYDYCEALPVHRCSITYNCSSTLKYLGGVRYIQVIERRDSKHKSVVKGKIEYPVQENSPYSSKRTFEFLYDLDSLNENEKPGMLPCKEPPMKNIWPVPTYKGEGIVWTMYPKGIFRRMWHRIKHPFGHWWLSKEIYATP